MARNDKPVKIKRYKNSMGGHRQQVAAAKRLLPFIGAAVLIVVAGFMLGKPVMNFISNIGGDSSSQIETNSGDNTLPTATPRPTPEQTPDETPENSQPEQPVETPPVQISENRVYYFVQPRAISTEAGIDSTIRQMQAKGATHLVFDVKNADGYVHYNSQNRYASQLKADAQIDLKLVSDKLKAKGLTPVARIYTFMDKMISTVERSTAVMYMGTDTRWLDTSAALGGKAWANPASKTMQDYILAITDEVLAGGVKEIIYAGFSTPTGYSLDKRDFGATTDQVLANMKNLIVTLQAKVSAKGGYSAWQIDYSAVMPEGSYAHYIIHPYQLGAQNYILTARGGEIDVNTAVTAAVAAEKNEDLNSVTLWLTDGVNRDLTASMDNYFKI